MKKNYKFNIIPLLTLAAFTACKKKEDIGSTSQKRLAYVISSQTDSLQTTVRYNYTYNDANKIVKIESENLLIEYDYNDAEEISRVMYFEKINQSSQMTYKEYKFQYQNNKLISMWVTNEPDKNLRIEQTGNRITATKEDNSQFKIIGIDNENGNYQRFESGQSFYNYEYHSNIQSGIGTNNKGLPVIHLLIFQAQIPFADLAGFWHRPTAIDRILISGGNALQLAIQTDKSNFITEQTIQLSPTTSFKHTFHYEKH